jgi:hypothetical protein
MTSFNITIPSINNTSDLVMQGQTNTGGLAVPIVLIIVFFGIVAWMKGSKISLTFAALVTLFLSLITLSLGWTIIYTAYFWMTVLVLSLAYLVIS